MASGGRNSSMVPESSFPEAFFDEASSVDVIELFYSVINVSDKAGLAIGLYKTFSLWVRPEVEPFKAPEDVFLVMCDTSMNEL